jgi:integrase
MATFRKRGAKWQAQIRRQGQLPVSQSFTLKSDAVAWARRTESTLDQGFVPDLRRRDGNGSLGDLFIRYRDNESPKKKGHVQERYRLEQLVKHPLSKTPLRALTAEHLAHYRDQRLQTVGPSTVRRELALIQRVLQIGIDEWRAALKDNPAARITKPKQSNTRERRLLEGEFNTLIKACRQGKIHWIEPLIHLAITTGMRRGELLFIEWNDVNFEKQIIKLRTSKNGYPRDIPLSSEALRVLKCWAHADPHVFPVSANAVRLAWERVRTRANICDLRFHDLRHEAISRFFELGLSMPEVALISGHRDYRMLLRYTHLRAENIVPKLN